jgi:hypothetical protein
VKFKNPKKGQINRPACDQSGRHTGRKEAEKKRHERKRFNLRGGEKRQRNVKVHAEENGGM